MEVVDKILGESTWFAGSDVTIADLSLLTSISQMKANGYNMSPYTNLSRWLESCKSLVGHDENERAAVEFGEYFKSIVGDVF
jgi:glutathione S-transferase